MRRFVARNKTLLLALTLAVLGAAALGVGFACALERQAETVSPVERENAVPLEAGSTPAGVYGAARPARAFGELRGRVSGVQHGVAGRAGKNRKAVDSQSP